MRFKGAESRLDDFQFIKTEAADFESYKNCGTTPQIQDFLRKRQFTLTRRVPFARLSLPASTVISCSSGNDSEADRLLNGTPFSRVTRLWSMPQRSVYSTVTYAIARRRVAEAFAVQDSWTTQKMAATAFVTFIHSKP